VQTYALGRERRVQRPVLGQRLRDGPNDQVGVGDLNAVLRLPFKRELRAKLPRLGHVDLAVERDVDGLAIALRELFGDDSADLRERLQLVFVGRRLPPSPMGKGGWGG
jgi:hypothetical protein